MFRITNSLLIGLVSIVIVDAAHAQSSVALYGNLDTGLYYQSKTTGTGGKEFSALDSGWIPSFWGFVGKEDLGGGLHMGFKLESGINTTNGELGNSNGNLFGRQAYLEFGGDFGRVRAGLQFSPFFVTNCLNGDPRGCTSAGSLFLSYVNGFKGLSGMFDSNTVQYLSPTVGGFSASFDFAPGGVAGSFQDNQRISASLNYQGASFGADIAYYQARDNGAGFVSLRGKTADLKYTLGPVKLTAQATNYQNNVPGVNTNDYVYDAGFIWSVTPALSLNGAYYYVYDKAHKPNQSSLVAVGASYSLSVRTALYAQAAYVENRGTMGPGIAATIGLPQGGTTGVNIGIRHFF